MISTISEILSSIHNFHLTKITRLTKISRLLVNDFVFLKAVFPKTGKIMSYFVYIRIYRS